MADRASSFSAAQAVSVGLGPLVRPGGGGADKGGGFAVFANSSPTVIPDIPQAADAPPTVTPLIEKLRYSPAIQLATSTVKGGEWTPFDAKFPLILWPIKCTDGAVTFGGGSQYVQLYAPVAIPNDDTVAQRSIGAGVVYLPAPGKWYVKNSGPSTSIVTFIVIDARDPAVAARYLSEGGNHRASVQTNVTVPLSGASVQLLAANRNRRGFVVYSFTASSQIRLGYGQSAVAGVGQKLFGAGNTSFSAFGDAVYKGDINAVSETAADASVAVVEYE
jgi:hypothetical protein